jgi:hypothetical protein
MRLKTLLTMGVPVLLLLLYLDPYSHGFVGGDTSAIFDAGMSRRLPNHPWQQWATGALVVLLLAALLACYKVRRLLMPLLLLEVATFLTLNLIYIARDGFWTRAEIGYASALPAAVASLGMICRISLLLFAVRWSRGRHRERARVGVAVD